MKKRITCGSVDSVLIATDFSENANTAQRWAKMIASAHGASLSVLHVAHATSIASLPREIQEKIAQSLEAVERQIAEEAIDVTSRWQAGEPWEVISAVAQEHDLVIIGARGQTPRAVHILGIGSTADRVLRSSPVPVLTVHTDDSPDDAFPKRVIVPTDFSETASRALDSAATLLCPADKDTLEITLLHAWQPLVEYGDVYGAVLLPNRCADSKEQAKELLEGLAAKVRTQSIDVTPVVRAGYPAKVIEEEADAIQADLVAIGTHGHSGLGRFMLGSVAERVVHHVDCPVLSVGPVAENAARHKSTGSAALARQSC